MGDLFFGPVSAWFFLRSRIMHEQFDFFGQPERAKSLPPGFRYREELITPAEEQGLLAHIRELPFRSFEFHGFTGKRRVVSFGGRYDFTERALLEAEEMPTFLHSLRESVAGFAGLDAGNLQHALVTEYSAGAGIGWHRDKGVFGEVIGVSLLASCVFRLRKKRGDDWERVNVTAVPRSAYLLSGLARTEWEHSIPPVDALRYSITFRNLIGPV